MHPSYSYIILILTYTPDLYLNPFLSLHMLPSYTYIHPYSYTYSHLIPISILILKHIPVLYLILSYTNTNTSKNSQINPSLIQSSCTSFPFYSSIHLYPYPHIHSRTLSISIQLRVYPNLTPCSIQTQFFSWTNSTPFLNQLNSFPEPTLLIS